MRAFEALKKKEERCDTTQLHSYPSTLLYDSRLFLSFEAPKLGALHTEYRKGGGEEGRIRASIQVL